MIIHFNFSLCALPLSLSPWPFSFCLPLCSSVKALRNYSQWFFSPAWAWSECLAELWAAPAWATAPAAASIFTYYLSCTSMEENCVPPRPGESTLKHRHQSLRCMWLLDTFQLLSFHQCPSCAAIFWVAAFCSLCGDIKSLNRHGQLQTLWAHSACALIIVLSCPDVFCRSLDLHPNTQRFVSSLCYFLTFLLHILMHKPTDGQ